MLRNTYALLALSLVPTVLGAWVGLQTGITAGLTGWMGFVVFMAGAFGFIYAIERNKNSGFGVALLLAFTFFMGLMLSRLLSYVMSMSNGTELVMTAFGGTAVVFTIMSTLATTIKRDLSGMGKFLMIGVIMLLVAVVMNLFLQSSALMITISIIALGIFSAYLLYDLKNIVDGGETNYISATLAVYLDLFNIFQNLLALLGIFGGDD